MLGDFEEHHNRVATGQPFAPVAGLTSPRLIRRVRSGARSWIPYTRANSNSVERCGRSCGERRPINAFAHDVIREVTEWHDGGRKTYAESVSAVRLAGKLAAGGAS